jgi:hypothetical protein
MQAEGGHLYRRVFNERVPLLLLLKQKTNSFSIGNMGGDTSNLLLCLKASQNFVRI